MTALEQLANDMREHVEHQGCACAQMKDFLQRLQEAITASTSTPPEGA